MHHRSHTPVGCLFAFTLSLAGFTQANDWVNWRGPLQNGVSLEHYTKAGKLDEKPTWSADIRSRGTPVVVDGKVILWGYKGETSDLIELVTCMDAKTGKQLWQHEIPDFLSDSVYNRYSIGAPTVDPETKRIYLTSNAGNFICYEIDGTKVFEIPMMEEFGRMTFPNSRVGSPVIEGEFVIIHFIFSNWGADGPAADRIYGFDKKTGELAWWSLPGVSPPVDSSFSTPVLETRDGKRVAYYTTGCGHIVCVNTHNGKPYWKMPICKNGVNPSVVLHKGNLIAIHGDENVDNSEKGRMTCIKLPEKLTAPMPPAMETATLEPSVEVWRNPIGATSSSPVLVGDVIYQLTDGAELYAIDANTGVDLWKMKLSNANLHSSPLYVDGLLYCPLLEGKIVVVKPGEKSGEIVQSIKLGENIQCLGAPTVCDGTLYVTTTEKFFAFKIPNKGIKVDAAPKVEMPKAGKAVALQIIPAETVVMTGNQQSFRVRSIDANGLLVSPKVEGVKWESFIPPTAKVKATMDAKFNDAGELVVAADAKSSAGAFKATSADGLSGTIRGRGLRNLPLVDNFDEYELKDEQPNEHIKFAYPPLPWIGARFKFDVREVAGAPGNKVLAKTFDRLMFQRGTIFVAPSNLSNYTLQADVMTDGSARAKSDLGLINQRYLICMRGNAGKLEISSNPERLKQEVVFKAVANTWYTLKTRVDVAKDGSGTVLAKIWDKAQPEPEAWTMEVKVPRAHKNGSPGIFGFTPLNQKRVYLDNLSVTPNK